MIPVQKKTRFKNLVPKPFPDNILIGYFTGYDVEVFDVKSFKALQETTYGMNPKPRQMMFHQEKLSKSTEADYKKRSIWISNPANDCDEPSTLDRDSPSDLSQSIVLFLEEAFFLSHQIECLEIRNLEDKIIPNEELWRRFSNIKETFVESYVSYLYLKSKNWVIKAGIKFGGDFREYF